MILGCELCVICNDAALGCYTSKLEAVDGHDTRLEQLSETS